MKMMDVARACDAACPKQWLKLGRQKDDIEQFANN